MLHYQRASFDPPLRFAPATAQDEEGLLMAFKADLILSASAASSRRTHIANPTL
jgi:hypothetical protein